MTYCSLRVLGSEGNNGLSQELREADLRYVIPFLVVLWTSISRTKFLTSYHKQIIEDWQARLFTTKALCAWLAREAWAC
jgi:hypothetical protein